MFSNNYCIIIDLKKRQKVLEYFVDLKLYDKRAWGYQFVNTYHVYTYQAAVQGPLTEIPYSHLFFFFFSY